MVQEETRLVEEARGGSKEAFAQILRLHQAHVRAYVSRYVQSNDLVDDLAQETFLDAYRSIRTYRGESSIRTWLLGIARHRALRYLEDVAARQAQEERTMDSSLAAWLERDLEEDSSALARQDEEMQALDKCLKSLPPMSTRLVEEFYYHGRSAVEIARRAGKKESAVWMTLLRIRRALRECIELHLRPTEAI